MELREALERDTSSEARGKGGPERRAQAKNGEDDVKMIEWEEFEDSLAHLCGTAKVLATARMQKEALAKKLEASLEARSKSLQRMDNFEALEKELQLRKLRLESLEFSLQKNTEKVAKDRELLLPSAHSLLFSSQALVSAQGRIQEADRLLAGDGGYLRLMQLRKLLFNRRRLMVAQVAGLYPLAGCNCAGIAATKHACSSRLPLSHPPGKFILDDGSTSKRPLSISGLHILSPGNKAPSLFGDKQNHEGTATALGNVAHDPSPATQQQMNMGQSIVVPSSEGLSNSALEFPLFSEGQDSTRAAYAIFLLNKDLEQLLNHLGGDSVGPRHTLPNLHRVLSTICSGKNPLV
ncbi:hypothetical protein O6H91_01G095200 [Diphasiastrum complanatum]|uniref:Uncharacterized protein n=1 Tax=Diphasiastrum complanatum TaxID=34168 RepID=A0ACC2ETK9_DIPCM|nr:hypothetical protein O6H91_01G095200 [Diphasiastrum complanatum]